MNVGDALTFKIVTDDHETAIHRSVVRSASPRSPVNNRVLFDANLDPAVRKDHTNANLELPDDFLLTDLAPTNVKRKKRRNKISAKQWTKIAETAKISDKMLADSGVPMTFRLFLRFQMSLLLLVCCQMVFLRFPMTLRLFR
jgi:hypothetical protein